MVAGLLLPRPLFQRVRSTLQRLFSTIAACSKSRAGFSSGWSTVFIVSAFTPLSQPTPSLHPVSGTVSLRLPPVRHLCLLRYARALPLPGFLAPVQRYSFLLLCLSLQDGFTLSPPRLFRDCSPHGALSITGYVCHLIIVAER